MTTTTLLVRDVLLDDGRRVSVRIVDGIVQAHLDRSTPTPHGSDVVEGGGRLLLPAMAEAHAHLDKAFLAEVAPNPTGDLMGACLAMDEVREHTSMADIVERAERAARLMAANGTTAIRTHADVTVLNGLTSVEALREVRERLRDLVRIEIVALCGWPSIGVEGTEQRALLRAAIDMGVDVVGGCPHLETDPIAGNATFLEIAAAAGLPLDLHTDEHLDPERSALEDLADRVLASGFPHRVTASHCVSLGMHGAADQQRIAEKLAAADISVVTLPSSNLYLQGRDRQTAMPRSLTALAALRAAGVTVAAGADNLQDPFNPVGRGDCLETAALLVLAGHTLPDVAYRAVSADVRHLMGLPHAGTAVGDVADLVLLPAASVREAIAFGPAGRTVIRSGRTLR